MVRRWGAAVGTGRARDRTPLTEEGHGMLVMREGVRGRLRNQWITTTRHAGGLRWQMTRAILNRFATAEMHHAALLLGYDIALGHGREGFFRYLDEFRSEPNWAALSGTGSHVLSGTGSQRSGRAPSRPSSWNSACSAEGG
jgi:hypothetical protein